MVSATEALTFALHLDMIKLYLVFFLGGFVAGAGNQITAGFIAVGGFISAVALVAILYMIVHDSPN